MKRVKNGMTIVEVLVSILIITIVVVLMFSMLIQIKNEEVNNNIQSSYLLNQASFVKAIEEDAVNYGVKKISACRLNDVKIPSANIARKYRTNYKCIKINYEANYTPDNIGFILIYNTYQKYDSHGEGVPGSEAWMIQYIRGHYNYDASGVPIGSPYYQIDNPNRNSWQPLTQTMRTFPNDIDYEQVPYLIYTAAPSGNTGPASYAYNAGNLIIPIVDPEGEHYDINVAFVFKGNDNFKCFQTSNFLYCKCMSNSALCNRTMTP